MAHYAKVVKGEVVSIIVAESDYFLTFIDNSPGQWLKASYNTFGGVHYGSDGKPDGGVALRKNFPGIGDSYDISRDAFIHRKPDGEGYLLNEETCLWEFPELQSAG